MRAESAKLLMGWGLRIGAFFLEFCERGAEAGKIPVPRELELGQFASL
jgi:hypothetical protein